MESKIIILEWDVKESFGDFGTFSIVYDPYWDGPIENYENQEGCRVIYTDKTSEDWFKTNKVFIPKEMHEIGIEDCEELKKKAIWNLK